MHRRKYPVPANVLKPSQLKLNSACYIKHQLSDNPPEYVGKLLERTLDKDKTPNGGKKWTLRFETTTFSNVWEQDPLYTESSCLSNFYNKQKQFNINSKRRRNTTKKKLNMCAQQKCKKLQNTFKNTKARMNNRGAYFKYMDCLEKECSDPYKANANGIYNKQKWWQGLAKNLKK